MNRVKTRRDTRRKLGNELIKCEYVMWDGTRKQKHAKTKSKQISENIRKMVQHMKIASLLNMHIYIQ